MGNHRVVALSRGAGIIPVRTSHATDSATATLRATSTSACPTSTATLPAAPTATYPTSTATLPAAPTANSSASSGPTSAPTHATLWPGVGRTR